MADVKISGLPASTTPLAGTEVLPIVQSSSTKQVSVANLTAGRDVSANIFSSAAGTAALPAITTSGDLNTGIFFPSADTIAFSEGGVEAMRLDASGNLGVGTTSPSGKLDVRQTVNNTDMFYGRRQADAGGGAGNFINFDSSGGGTSVFKVSTRADIEAGTLLLAPVKKGTGSLTFVLDAGDATTTQNTQAYRFRQYITTGGSIPSFSIEPTRDGDFNYTALLVNATENTVGTATGKYLLNLQRNGTSRFVVQSYGNVGIGTATPNASAILDVQSTTKGVRMPNMTTTEKNAIASPAAGLMVFDTTLSKLCVYTSAWETITSL
jgi:hypothetical protein